MSDFTQLNQANRPYMSDISELPAWHWQVKALARVRMKPETLVSILAGQISGGDVLSIAAIGGVLGTKRSPEAVPLRHPQQIAAAKVDFEIDSLLSTIDILVTVKTRAVVAAEVEALAGAFAAALSIYDMCNPVAGEMHIDKVCIVESQRLEAETSKEGAAGPMRELLEPVLATPVARLRVITAGESRREARAPGRKRKLKAKPKAKGKASPKAKVKRKAVGKAKPKGKTSPKSKAKSTSKAKAKVKRRVKTSRSFW